MEPGYTEYGYKTLILLDNSASVSMANREIVKETLKYLLRNAPEQDRFALATFSEQTELLVDYGKEYSDYCDAIERISYIEKRTCVTDVLMQTLRDWEEGDFAMRNILLITDGMGEESTTYPVEELYFKLNEDPYPVYAIALNQQTNEMLLRRIGSLARISHGQVFYSEFEGSDAEVERQLSEQIYQAMEDRRALELQGIVEGDEQSSEETTEETYEYENYYAEPQEIPQTETLIQESHMSQYKQLFLVGAVLLVALLVLIVMSKLAGRKDKRQDSGSSHHQGMNRTTERALLPEKSPMEVTIEDLNNPMRYFHLPPMERILIGSDRRQADVWIGEEEEISDRHCEIHYHLGKYYVRDLESKCGTYINGQRLYQETELHSADVITLGHAKLLVTISRFQL